MSCYTKKDPCDPVYFLRPLELTKGHLVWKPGMQFMKLLHLPGNNYCMNKNLQLSISEPCHENWDAMTAAEKGRFCGSCQKQVIDFSNMNEHEIAAFFKKPSTGFVCGRFKAAQLKRKMEAPRKQIPWLRYFFQLLLPAFFISKADGQTGKPGKAIQSRGETIQHVTDEMLMMGQVLRTEIMPACTKEDDKTIVKTVTKKVKARKLWLNSRKPVVRTPARRSE